MLVGLSTANNIVAPEVKARTRKLARTFLDYFDGTSVIRSLKQRAMLQLHPQNLIVRELITNGLKNHTLKAT